MRRILLPVLLLLGAFAAPAQAALFDDEEARARIEQLRRENDARFEKLEAAGRGQMELANQIELLRAELSKLRGQLEVLTFEMEQTQKRQRDFYVDLDNRVRKLETAPPPAPPPPAQEPAAPRPDPAAETRDYESALNLFKAGRYKEAVAAFDAFSRTYPASAFTPSATYWAGQSLYQLRDCRRALDLFHKLSSTWPDDPKAPDAMLGMAICQQEMGDGKGDAKNARMTLEALVSKYPNSPAAQAARERLKRRR